MKYREIYNICVPESKRKEDQYNIAVTYLLRPLSILIIKVISGTKITPICITKWSVFFCILGFITMCCNQSLEGVVLGWFFFFLWALLDCVDGNLARFTNQCSMLGDLWDTMGGYAAMVLIYFSSAIVAYFSPQKNLIFDSVIILILGCATSVIAIFPRLVMHKRKSSDYNDDAVRSISDKPHFGFPQIIAMNLVSPTGLVLIFFLMALIFNLINYFILFYFIINMGIMSISLYRLLK